MILVKNATIVDSNSEWHLKKADILINNGKIEKIGASLKSEAKHTYEGEDLCISPSWIDIGCQVNDPGHEERETLPQLLKSATNGGYGLIAPFTNTSPTLDNKAAIESLIQKGKGRIYPIANISKSKSGEEISEMYDLNNAGVKVFSDGLKSGLNHGLLMRALQYVKPIGGKVMVYPMSHTFSQGGQMHEGVQSTLLGMKGIPHMAEFTHLQTQIDVLEYSDSHLIIFGVSSERSLSLIKKAISKNMKIEAVVPYLNLVFTDEKLNTFETSFKLLPPLREGQDRKALIKGIKDGTIKAISSNHAPFDTETKDLEFEYSEFGAAGIENVYSALQTHTDLKTEEIIEALTYGPANILGVSLPSIHEGIKGSFTIFDRSITYTYNSKHPTAINNPWEGKELKGKVLAVLG